MVKNTRQDTGLCKTIVQIDNETVFTSPAYEWKHPAVNKTEFRVSTSNLRNDFQDESPPKGAIRSIAITSFE